MNRLLEETRGRVLRFAFLEWIATAADGRPLGLAMTGWVIAGGLPAPHRRHHEGKVQPLKPTPVITPHHRHREGVACGDPLCGFQAC